LGLELELVVGGSNLFAKKETSKSKIEVAQFGYCTAVNAEGEGGAH
jgi:hypothetical protein